MDTNVEYRSLEFLGYPNYRVGDDGSVWSWYRNLRWRRMKSISSWKKSPKAYYWVTLFNEHGSKKFWVHHLVLLAFVGPCPEGYEGCHFPDPDRSNNSLINLRWDTVANNQLDRKEQGTWRCGEQIENSRLTDHLVENARMLHEMRKGKYKGSNRGLMQGIARDLGLEKHYHAMRLAILRKTWKHVP